MNEHFELFAVVDKTTGEAADPYNIALNPHHAKRHEWAKRLIYCDMEGWLIDSEGCLFLADECGRFEYAPEEQYKVVFNDDWKSRQTEHAVSPEIESEIQWLANGHRGVSSNAMFAAITGIETQPPYWSRQHPCDPSDLRRCELMLRRCPHLRPHMDKAAELSTEWRALVEHWDELCMELEEEVPGVWEHPHTDRAPKTYTMMQELISGNHG